MEGRFWAKVDKRGPDECWLWTAYKDCGYGIFSCGYNRDKKSNMLKKAHVVSYTMFNGPISPGSCVCHKCDNPGCVNPAHLFLGSHKDNMADKKHKGRALRAERIINSDSAADIRRLYALGSYTQSELAEKFGTSRQNIGKIILERTFK